MPACGVRPDAIANAIAKGSATRPTVTPAIRSAVRSPAEYPDANVRTERGSQSGSSRSSGMKRPERRLVTPDREGDAGAIWRKRRLRLVGRIARQLYRRRISAAAELVDLIVTLGGRSRKREIFPIWGNSQPGKVVLCLKVMNHARHAAGDR